MGQYLESAAKIRAPGRRPSNADEPLRAVPASAARLETLDRQASRHLFAVAVRLSARRDIPTRNSEPRRNASGRPAALPIGQARSASTLSAACQLFGTAFAYTFPNDNVRLDRKRSSPTPRRV